MTTTSSSSTGSSTGSKNSKIQPSISVGSRASPDTSDTFSSVSDTSNGEMMPPPAVTALASSPPPAYDSASPTASQQRSPNAVSLAASQQSQQPVRAETFAPTVSPSTTSAPVTTTIPVRSLPPLSSRHENERMLPPLSTVAGSQEHFRIDMATAMNPPSVQWPALGQPISHPNVMSLPPIEPHAHRRSDSLGLSRMDLDGTSNGGATPTSPGYRHNDRSGSVSLDDPDVRLAAEALGDLRADFVSSPPNIKAVLPISPPAVHQSTSGRSQSPQAPEPLFSLLTTSHPLLATTIEGATSAYGGAKNFSPRFKSSAEYVEGYLTPIANTVGSVGRVTGVEGGVRWFLGAGRRKGSDLDAGGSSKKRRKVDGEGEPSNKKRLEAEGINDIWTPSDSSPSTPKADRRLSFASTVDTLPAYDDARSPAYTETMELQKPQPSASLTQPPNPAWQSRLIMSTSGLSVAMSEESLRSLKYCLRWLRWANEHIGGVVGNLKTTLEQYEEPVDSDASRLEAIEGGESGNNEAGPVDEKATEQSRAELATRINTLKNDVLKTLRDVIGTVSKYTGGALPDNARILVRRHLTSLPQRFRVATMSEQNAQGASPDNEAAVREGAHKVLVLAKEGLDMMSQVSGVLDGTIVSAEEWCERMGRKKRRSRDAEEGPVLPIAEPSGDVKMG